MHLSHSERYKKKDDEATSYTNIGGNACRVQKLTWLMQVEGIYGQDAGGNERKAGKDKTHILHSWPLIVV